MKPCCPPPAQGQYLPISTGNIGISQTSGGLEFYGHNYHGRGIGLFRGQWCEPPCAPPQWPPPSWGGAWGGCSCGGSCSGACGCRAGSNCFAYYLTNPAMWICYWRDQAARQILTTPPATGATG